MEKQHNHNTTMALGLGFVILISGAILGWLLMLGTSDWHHMVEQVLCWWLALGVPVALVRHHRQVRWYFGRVRQLKRTSPKGQMPKVLLYQRLTVLVIITLGVLYGHSFVVTLSGGTSIERLNAAAWTSMVLAFGLILRYHKHAKERTEADAEYVPADELFV